ncbi:DUF2069 domain-containing protein [Parendozoicomonas haliclonae]|uniref:DUF2069 domain-containing protein n=1 Tax=Parendozoicomonas haliclonae TaxID=1960125 RepID=A0A1X7APS3_9GAMM|nr:DUF2069 domain-containing protein [Parendozoicomonas haliclonae]SMA50112.1 hypothetical protein EHSB41UT_03903 [Parendozoicomonas haliclonae]
MSKTLGPKAQTTWLLSVILYFLLLVTITLDHWLWAPPEVDSPWLIWAFRIVPLLIFVPAVISKHGRGFAWLGFVVLFYFTSGVVKGWTYESWEGWLLAGESLLLFITTILFVRWYFQGK